MAVPKPVSDCIARVLKAEMRKGHTTKQDVVLLAMNEMGRRGDYGLPPAMLKVVAQRIYQAETERQLKSGLPDNVVRLAFRNAPPELVQVMPKLPAWIALSEGLHARWVPSLQATAEEWMANARMKQKKAQQTLTCADASADLARYLSEYGLNSLSDVLWTGAEAAE